MSTARRKLLCLSRRADFLASLIAKYPDRPMSYERQEFAALRWAIEVVTGVVAPAVGPLPRPGRTSIDAVGTHGCKATIEVRR